jgi:enoyl-CoA hydratase/carnithine racemase
MDEIGAIVVTGKGKAFAAGADIPEMITKDFAHETDSNGTKTVCMIPRAAAV